MKTRSINPADHPGYFNKGNSDMITKLYDVRLSFPHLFEPTAFKAGDALKFSACFLVPKKSDQGKQIEKDMLEAMTSKFGAKAKASLEGIRGNTNKCCVQDGDNSEYEGYAGNWVVRAKSDARPVVVDQNKNPLTQADGKPYSGCYVNASIEFFAYDNSGKGLSAKLRAVAFKRDGDSFSGGTKLTDDEVDDLADGASAGSEDTEDLA